MNCNSWTKVSVGQPVESPLLQLSDLPGVSVKSTLVPGASVGASDLIVDVSPGQRVTGSIDADNARNRYTGEERLGGTANLNNPLLAVRFRFEKVPGRPGCRRASRAHR